MSQMDNSPYGVSQRGTSNATAIYLAATTGSQVVKLPAAWGSEGPYYVKMTALNSECRYLLANHADAAVSVVSGTATGASGTTAGGLLLAGIKEEVKVPEGCLWLAFIAKSSTTDISVELASDTAFWGLVSPGG